MIDFVIPDGNEEELSSMSAKLGYSGVCFVYGFDNFKTGGAILCDKNFDRAKQKAKFVIASGLDARKAIESKRVDFVCGVETEARRDAIHFRNSGLNHVLCTLMKENNVGYLISVKDILFSKDPQFLGRVMQNISLCRKFKVKVEIGSFASDVFSMKGANDMKSLMKVL
jgi:RNase P/RNase MRP subunit p30